MADQAKITDGDERPPGGVSTSDGVFRLAQEAVELGELQMRLLRLDVQNSSANARAAMLYAALGIVLALCAAQVLLLCVAAALVEWAGWSWVAALATSVGVGVLLAGVLLRVSWLHLQEGMFTWERSRSELAKNLAWLKASLRGGKGASGHSSQGTASP